MPSCPQTLLPSQIKTKTSLSLTGEEPWLEELTRPFLKQQLCSALRISADFELERLSPDVEHFQMQGEFRILAAVVCDRCAARRELNIKHPLKAGLFEDSDSDAIDVFGFCEKIDFFEIFNDLLNTLWPNQLLCEQTTGEQSCVRLNA